MPFEVYDAEGNKVEGVLDPAEVKALQESATKVADLEKELGVIKQEVNPNWQEARRKMKQLEDENANFKKLKETGKTVNEKGEVVEFKENGTSVADTTKIAEDAAKRVTASAFVENRKKQHLAEFSDDKRKVVEHYFNKLSAGEEMTEEKVDEYMDSARRASGVTVNPVIRAQSFSSGRGYSDQKEPEFADSEKGSQFADAMGLKIKK